MARLRYLNNRRGQAVVETAMVLPLILLMLLGILEFGRIMAAYMTITHSAREGARLAALGGTEIQVEQRVKDVSAWLDTGQMTVTKSPLGVIPRGDMVTVTVHYNQDLMMPLIGIIVGDPLPMDADVTMRVE